MWQLIAQQTTGSDPVEWIQYGVLGLVVLGLLTGWLWPKPAVDKILADAERDRNEYVKHTEVLATEIRELRSEVRQLTEEARRRDRTS